MKKCLACALILCLFIAGAAAEVISGTPYSFDFYADMGVFAQDGLVLCESLTVREGSNSNAKQTDTLLHHQAFVTDKNDGAWLHIYYADGAKQGWVRGEYVLLSPSYFVTEQGMTAYAYGDEDAPCVAWLEKGQKLPIIQQFDGWLVVSLRGASAWISHDKPVTLAGELPRSLGSIKAATLCYTSPQTGITQAVTVTDTQKLSLLSAYLVDNAYRGEKIAGCGFGMAELALTCMDGTTLTLSLAGDDCCTVRFRTSDFDFAVGQKRATNRIVFDLFGIAK